MYVYVYVETQRERERERERRTVIAEKFLVAFIGVEASDMSLVLPEKN
jgi:hypothetical protein